MAIEFTKKTDAELKTIIENCERSGRTDHPNYAGAKLEQNNRKTSGSLEIGQTVQIIARAATRRRFLSYGQIAQQSGVAPITAKNAVPKHLELVNRHALQQGWPMLSAIVVTKPHLTDGGMDPDTLTGFCKSAEALGLDVGDTPAAFLKHQQDAVFEAASKGVFG